MRTRRFYLVMLGVLVVAVLVAVFSSEREPEYQGKRLSEWVIEYGIWQFTDSAPPPEEVVNAIGHIGKNARPYLVKWISYETPVWKDKLYRVLKPVFGDRKVSWHLSEWNEYLRSVGAIHILMEFHLEPDIAREAIPALLRMLKNPDVHKRVAATNALRQIDPQALERATR